MRIKGETTNGFTKLLGVVEGAAVGSYSPGIETDAATRNITINLADLPKELTKIIIWNTQVTQEPPNADPA